jgi:type I restriction enzyme S subunit
VIDRTWETKPLWSIVSEVRRVVDPEHLSDPVIHYSIPSFDSTGGGGGEESPEDIRSSKLRLRGGEVLISKLNPRKSRVTVAAGSARQDIVASTEFVAMVPSVRINLRYLMYVLSAENVRQELDSMVQSVTRSHQRVSPEQIMRLKVPVPPLEEQRRIADFLDVNVHQLDAVSRARGRQVGLLEERARSEISECLFPGISDLADRNQTWPWLPIESDRPLVRLALVASLQSGVTIDAARDVGDDSVVRPYLRVANVQNGYVDLTSISEVTVPAAMARRSTLRRGDVLMTEGGDLDKLGRGALWSDEVPGCLHQNHIFAIRSDVDRLDAEYLMFLTQSVHGRCYFESTGVKTTNLASTNSSKIMSFPVPLPALDEQRALAAFCRSVTEEADRVNRVLRRQVDLLIERRQALITAAVTGQVDVTNARGVGAS